MSDEHLYNRLEKNGTVIAYFAPSAEVNVTDSSDLTSFAFNEKAKEIKDYQKITSEFDLQGSFVSSSELKNSDHANDLEDLFGFSPVTPSDQVNRIRYFHRQKGGPFEFYNGDDKYTATNDSDLDIKNGIFPTAYISNASYRDVAGEERIGYTIKLEIGVPY